MAAPIQHIPAGTFSEEEIDGLCDWYDQALASGQGFKTEEERKKYFDDLGDPLSHPLFAGSTEDMEGNDMVEAFRCLREEDKTNVELAIMYKDEGNEWMKKKVQKDLKEAIIRYSHALTFLDADDSDTAAEENEPRVTELDEVENSKDLQTNSTATIGGRNNVLRSQILNNRALASMHLKNYGTALGDINMALLLWPHNIKAHYRKCKCLLALSTKRRSQLALNAALAGLQVDPDNAELRKLVEQCEKAVATEKKKVAEAEERQRQREARWTEAWMIAKKRKANFGRPDENWHHPPQLTSPLPFFEEVEAGDSGSKMICKDCWPMVVLYPQYRQIDVIQAVDPSTMLVMLLAEMFPEPEDDSLHRRTVPWDVDGEYYVSNLAVYIHLSSCPRFKSCEEWLDYNREAAKKGACIESSEDEDFDKLTVSQLTSGMEPSAKMKLCEVHLGCTIERILGAKGHVLEGGLLSLVVFPKANTSPSNIYMKRFGGRENCELLNPVG